jgi:hypothetical protein
MANDIRNRLYVRGPKEAIKAFYRDNCQLSPEGKELGPLTFNRLLPFPSDKELRKLYSRGKVASGEAGINWGYTHWGTKWDPNDGARVRRSPHSLLYVFITANREPQAWVRAASKAYPSLRFKLHYWPDDYLPRFIVHFFKGRPKVVCRYVWRSVPSNPKVRAK